MKRIFTNPISAESCLLIKKYKSKEREVNISDRPEPVAFGLWLASSSSKLMNARMTSLESSFPPESVASLSYLSLSRSSVSLLSTLALLSFSVNVLAFLSVALPAQRGLFCCKHDCLTIAFTFSLLLLFECCLSAWWFKYLFCSGTHSFCSFVTSLHSSVQGLSSYDSSFTSQLSFAFSSALFVPFNSRTSSIKTLCHFKVLLKYFTWGPLFPYFLAPTRKPFFFLHAPTLQIPAAAHTSVKPFQ